MKALRILLPAFLATGRVTATPQARLAKQVVLDGSVISNKPVGVGHFSEWSRATKKAFLVDWQAGKASEWGKSTRCRTAAIWPKIHALSFTQHC